MRASLHALYSEWRNLLQRTSARCDCRDSFARLVNAYSEEGRYYHTLDHIDQCLGVFQQLAKNLDYPFFVAYAIWFHDYFYAPGGTENEYRSADYAESFFRKAQLTKFIAPVRDLILATSTHRREGRQDIYKVMMLDVDLSILGAEPIEFRRYEQGIRKEYAFVPEEVYRKKRSEILEQFLNSKPLFRTDYCKQRFEQQAEVNLKESIERLRQ